jgi:hypothetical protein
MSTLYPTVVQFFMTRMNEHSCVGTVTRLSIPDEYIYKIERENYLPDIHVFLTDAYRFGLADYLGRPSCISRGDYILIARPEASFDTGLIERAAKDGIGIGKIGRLMGALNLRYVSKYKSFAKQVK